MRPDEELRRRQGLASWDVAVDLVHRGHPFVEDVAAGVLPWSYPASDSGWAAFHRREVSLALEDQSYPVVLRVVLEEAPEVDLAAVVLAVALALTVGETVHPEVLPGRGSTVASDIAAEYRRIAEPGFARPAAC